MTTEQLQEWREDANRLAARAPTVPFFELMTDCSAAIVALIAEVERLQGELADVHTYRDFGERFPDFPLSYKQWVAAGKPFHWRDVPDDVMDKVINP